MSARSPLRCTSSRGFTLLELLVALFGSAVMFTVGYAGLAEAARNRASVHDAQQSLSELQRAVRVLTTDLSQLNPRPVRDELGRGVAGSIVTAAGTPSPIAFTRGGRPALAHHARGSLQRIEYLIENGELVRISWQMLDRAQGSAAARRVLMRGARSLRLRFLDERGEWIADWPAPQAAGSGDRAILRSRPRAIEVSLITERYGEIRRVIEVPG